MKQPCKVERPAGAKARTVAEAGRRALKACPFKADLRWLLISGLALWFAGRCALPCNAAETAKPAEDLYLQIGKVGLDATRVFLVRGGSITRPGIQITLEDGTIAFTEDVAGKVTGAFFAGDGEVLVTPPNEVERRSMSLFTGMAILEERFATAYFRFNDDVANELQPGLRAPENPQEFVQRWNATAQNLASGDAMRMLLTLSRSLPTAAGTAADDGNAIGADRFLHARLQGLKFGVFDVYYDSTLPEPVQVGQVKAAENGQDFYDVWTSFATGAEKPAAGGADSMAEKEIEGARQNRIAVRRYTIDAEVVPPKQIRARARLDCEVDEGGVRILVFELSRYLQIESVKLDGKPVEYIQNPALEGTQLSRRGNDMVAVVLPEVAQAGQGFNLEFEYQGEVLAAAGSGLLYVGARGTWYPNRGLTMADFDLQFSYPQEWTLVATGRPAQIVTGRLAGRAGGQTSRWVSERPIPLAGFNLGKYREATTRAGDVEVKTYAASGVENGFPTPTIKVIEPKPLQPREQPEQVEIAREPSPVMTEVQVGQSAARAIEFFAARFGPFPYSRLALTQMPGRESQGWPGLIFLSSYAFLSKEEREELHYSPLRILLQESVPAHETAHQWWGDLVSWRTYRDQWFSEGLATYCALMMLEEKDPAGFRGIMEQYRRELVEKNKDGISPMDAGPVTLGTRLVSSRFPEGFDEIAYGRGAWLFHMLRTMMKDGAQEHGRQTSSGSSDEPFMRALKKVRERYQGKAITTRELLNVLAEELPPSLRYEGKPSLDWFLDDWMDGTSLPRLELKSVKMTPKGAGMAVSGIIVQADAPENLVTSVPVYAAAAGRQLVLLGRVFADGEETSFHFAAPAGTHRVVLDPYETVLTAPK